MRYGQTKTVAATLAGLLQARTNCIKAGNTDWQVKHEAGLNYIAGNFLPSGAGIDNGSALDWTKSTADKLVILVPFHRMDDSGMYAGWIDYTVTVRPDWDGINVSVRGRDYNGLRDYLQQTFDHVLSLKIRQAYDEQADRSTYELV